MAWDRSDAVTKINAFGKDTNNTIVEEIRKIRALATQVFEIGSGQGE